MNPFSYHFWQALWNRRQVKRDIDDELAFHIEQRARDNQASGFDPEAARREARKQFGNFQSVREDCRAARGLALAEGLFKDLRFAARMLRRNPLFTLVAVLSLALGIGANVAIFSIVNAILLRSLAVPNPQELRVVNWLGIDPQTSMFIGSLWDRTQVKDKRPDWMKGGQPAGRSVLADAFTYNQFVAMRAQCAPLADLFGYVDLQGIAVHAQGDSFVANGTMVSGNFFSGLGTRPVLGRLLAAKDDALGAEPTLVITYTWWQRRFGLDPGVLGRAVTLNGRSFTIIGVLPPGFNGVKLFAENEFYIALSAQSQLMGYVSRNAPDHWWVRLMARIKPKVNELQLRTALEVPFTALAAEQMKSPAIDLIPGQAGPASEREYFRRPLLVLLGAVGTVLLVACANLAGLSLARGAARQHELSVRAALGAGRWRLARQALVESLLLSLLGGGLGLLLAFWGKTAVARLLAGSADGLRYDLSLDFKVLGFTLVAALAVGLLSGMLPAWRAGRAKPLDGLKERAALGAPQLRAGRTLVAAQIALSVLLVAGAGLYVRTLINLTRINPGFSTQNLLLFQVRPDSAGLRAAAMDVFYDRLQASLADIPGVRSATLLQLKLLSGAMSNGDFFKLPAHPEINETHPQTNRLAVGETFFNTMGIPILNGRSFTAGDSESAPKVVVVNEKFARSYFPGESAVGQILQVGEDHGNPIEWRIAGVCRDAKYSGLKTEVAPTVYFCWRQDRVSSAWFAVRTSVTPLRLAAAVRQAVRAVDPTVPISGLTTQQAVVDEGNAQETLFASLCGALALLAVLLACIGLYGLMAYNVARRAHEIGVRMALGAGRREIAWPIVREALALALAGVAVGLPAALALARLIENQLYGVAPTDPLSLAGAVVLLVAVAVLAAWLPARRAARMDPMLALRCE